VIFNLLSSIEMGQTDKGTCAFPAKTNRFIFLLFPEETKKNSPIVFL